MLFYKLHLRPRSIFGASVEIVLQADILDNGKIENTYQNKCHLEKSRTKSPRQHNSARQICHPAYARGTHNPNSRPILTIVKYRVDSHNAVAAHGTMLQADVERTTEFIEIAEKNLMATADLAQEVDSHAKKINAYEIGELTLAQNKH